MKEKSSKRQETITFLVFILMSFLGFSQNNVLKDTITGEVIAFAAIFSIDTTKSKVLNDINFNDFEKNYHGTDDIVYYSDENGNFEKLNSKFKTYCIEIPGYKNKYITGNTKGTIFLEPLPEIKADTELKLSKTLSIDKQNKTPFLTSYGRRNKATQMAKFFSWKNEYQDTPFLKSIITSVRCEIKKAYFRIRIYQNDGGFPGEELTKKSIIATVKKNKKNVEVDLEPYKIVFPNKGVFVALEWIVNEDNKLTRRFEYNNSRLELNQPSFKFSNNKNGISLIYSNGEWFKVQRTAMEETEGYFEPAIEIILSN